MPLTARLLVTLCASCLAVLGVGAALALPWPAVGALMMVPFGATWYFSRASTLRDTPEPEVQSVPLPSGLGRRLLHRMPAPLMVIGSNRRLTYANPAALDLLPNAQPGGHFSTMVRAPAFVDAIETILREEEDLRFAFSMVRSGGDLFLEARASFLPPAAAQEFGEGAQIIIQIEDRTRDKAVLQTRSDFVANASHELRTPLASILGYIETLQGHAKEDPEARELFLGIMMQQAQRMQRLVDDLMSLSRIEMNAHVKPDRRLDFFAVVAEAANALFPQATAADVLLQIELPLSEGTGPEVMGDRDQLAQVVTNLIDNAIKYGGRGEKVRVTVAEPDPRFPGQVGVSVIDRGPGIAREHIPRLTERFFRVSPSQSKNLGGTGLGLAITKHILARHSGGLDIKSQLGEGSAFTLWVPLAVKLEDADEGEKTSSESAA